MNRLLLFSVCLHGVICSESSAGTVYFGEDVTSYPPVSRPNSDAARDDFLASLTTPFATEDFDSLVGINPTLTFGLSQISASTSNSQINGQSDDRAITAPNYLGNDSFAGDAVFLFSEPITAFGLYMVDAGTVVNGQTSVQFESTANPALTQVVPVDLTLSNNNDKVLYFGFIDEASPFDRVTIRKNNPDDSIAFDSLTVSVPSSPPGSFTEPSQVVGGPDFARSTFLQPADPREVLSQVANPEEINLATGLDFVVEPGDYLRLQSVGSFDFAAADDNLEGPFGDGTLRDAAGVFSSLPTAGAVDIDNLTNRVPQAEPVLEGDAVPLGGIGGIDGAGIAGTDIDHDFVIPTETGDDPDGVVIKVPDDATHLFLGAIDGVFNDNVGNGFGVRITRLYEGRFVGDYNFDGVVDAADYTVWRDSQGETGIDRMADGNLDGVVDEADYQIWRDGFGTFIGTPDTNAVPEPAAFLLVLAGVSPWWARRR